MHSDDQRLLPWLTTSLQPPAFLFWNGTLSRPTSPLFGRNTPIQMVPNKREIFLQPMSLVSKQRSTLFKNSQKLLQNWILIPDWNSSSGTFIWYWQETRKKIGSQPFRYKHLRQLKLAFGLLLQIGNEPFYIMWINDKKWWIMYYLWLRRNADQRQEMVDYVLSSQKPLDTRRSLSLCKDQQAKLSNQDMIPCSTLFYLQVVCLQAPPRICTSPRMGRPLVGPTTSTRETTLQDISLPEFSKHHTADAPACRIWCRMFLRCYNWLRLSKKDWHATKLWRQYYDCLWLANSNVNRQNSDKPI